MTRVQLTLKSIRARPVVVPLKRPIVSGLFKDWPLILIDLYTNEGVVGHSYLEPYLKQSVRYIVPALEDLAEAAKDQPLAPFDSYRRAIGSLHLVGREGISLIATSGLDMAAWDALAKAADMPLAVFLGGTVGPVPAYSSNGLWLTPLDKLSAEAAALVAEGGFTGLKLRLGREKLADDLAAIAAVRDAAGAAVKDNISGYAQLTRELKTPIQLGENFYGPRLLYQAVLAGAGDYVMPDLMRIGGVTGWLRAAAITSAAGIPMSTHLYPEIAAHLMRVTDTAHWLEWQDWADPILSEPFQIKDGHLLVPGKPGQGIEWNEKAVARFAC